MRRREFIAGIIAAAWPLAAQAQPRNPIKRIAFVATSRSVLEPVFRQELAGLGWAEGRDVHM
jgi:hypothetical protein